MLFDGGLGNLGTKLSHVDRRRHRLHLVKPEPYPILVLEINEALEVALGIFFRCSPTPEIKVSPDCSDLRVYRGKQGRQWNEKRGNLPYLQ